MRLGSALAWPLLSAPAQPSLHIRPLTVLAVAALLILGHALRVITSPQRTCRRCNGQRVRVRNHWLTGRPKPRPCKRCRATGLTPRLGARWLHQSLATIRAERADNRRHDDQQEDQ